MDKPRICAFAICATDDRNTKVKDHLVTQLQWYVPGVDVVEVSIDEAQKSLAGIQEKHIVDLSMLCIPLLDRLRKYERVIWLEPYLNVRSGMFAGILNVNTSESGLAAVEISSDGNTDKGLVLVDHDDKRFDSSVVVFDLTKIDKQKWQKLASGDLSGNVSVAPIDVRYNCVSSKSKERNAAWCINYRGRDKDLEKIVERNASSLNTKEYIAVSPKHGNVVRWIRSYFAMSDGSALVLIRRKDWSNDEIDYCKAAIEFCGGILIDGEGKVVSDAEVRQTLDGLKITKWHHVDADMDIQDHPLKSQDEYPATPFESAIHDIAKNVKMVEVTPVRVPDEEAIDAVFVIGTGSMHKNEELRYALRDVAKHCPFVRDVYISGECPDWVDKSVVKHLQWPDRFRHAKDANIIDKLRHACEQKGIAKRILFCSDDQFQTRVCTWDDFFPRQLRQYTSEDTWYADRKRVWHTRLRNTLERDKKRRQAAGLDTSHVFYFEPHMWMQIDRDKFIEYAKWSDYEHSADTIIASGYFNFINAEGHPHDKGYDHVFMGEGTKTMPKVTNVAYTDEGFDQAMVFLKQLFPEKCRFELGGNTGSSGSAKAVQATSVHTPAAKPATVLKAAPRAVDPMPTITIKPARLIDRAAIKAAIHKRIFGRI